MYISRILGVITLAGFVACNSGPTSPSSGGGQDLPPAVPRPTGMPSTPAPTGTTGVTIQDFSFTPAAVTIKVGTAVQWTNNGPSAHTTTSDTGVWDSGILSPSSMASTFTFTFMQPGTFHYHCSIHPPILYPGFVGTVTVTQ